MKRKNNKELAFYREYISNYTSAFDDEKIDKIYHIQKKIEEKINKKKFIFVCGNGGSASVANHFLCDFNKGIKETSSKKKLPKVLSLSSNIELITAIANDISYDQVFLSQLENYSNPGDCLILLSCSGNSKNIIEICKFAKKKKLFIISFTGFSKNKNIKKFSDINYNIGIKNFGICEDIFQSIMHMISQSIRQKFTKKKIIL